MMTIPTFNHDDHNPVLSRHNPLGLEGLPGPCGPGDSRCAPRLCLHISDGKRTENINHTFQEPDNPSCFKRPFELSIGGRGAGSSNARANTSASQHNMDSSAIIAIIMVTIVIVITTTTTTTIIINIIIIVTFIIVTMATTDIIIIIVIVLLLVLIITRIIIIIIIIIISSISNITIVMVILASKAPAGTAGGACCWLVFVASNGDGKRLSAPGEHHARPRLLLPSAPVPVRANDCSRLCKKSPSLPPTRQDPGQCCKRMVHSFEAF